MPDNAADTAREYAEAVFARTRTPIEPPGFRPDWADQPIPFKRYVVAPRTPLPVALTDRTGPVDGLSTLGALLRLCYGIVGRRVDVNANNDLAARSTYPGAIWARGAASGGGLYPLELYLVSGPSSGLVPGVYHYSSAHHALERLAAGDLTGRLRTATHDHPAAAATDQFLVVTVRFWRNAFKYHNFSYQVVTQDVGAMLGAWQALAGGPPPLLWFADRDVDTLLGLNTSDESAFAVLPLPCGRPAQTGGRPARPGMTVRTPPVVERSREVRRFALASAAHEATLVGDEPRPIGVADSTGAGAASDGAVALPPPAPLDLGRAGPFLARRSSFGRFVAAPEITTAELATVLAALAGPGRLRSDVTPAGGGLTRLMVFANRVAGVPAGQYHYDGTLVPVGPPGAVDLFLQGSYQLANYDLGQVGAVVAIVGRLGRALDAFGGRGLRVLNAEAGALAQYAYLASAALGLGCGAVLGFDNLAMNDALGLTGTDDRSVLFLLLGRERPGPAALDLTLPTGRAFTAGVPWPAAAEVRP